MWPLVYYHIRMTANKETTPQCINVATIILLKIRKTAMHKSTNNAYLLYLIHNVSICVKKITPYEDADVKIMTITAL